MLIHEGEFKSLGELSHWEMYVREYRREQWRGNYIQLDRGQNEDLKKWIIMTDE
jgi:hypothetical protein